MSEPVAQRFFHRLARHVRDIEGWITRLEAQDLASLCLLFQQPVAHLDNGPQ